MVVLIAAGYAFLGAQETQRTLTEKSIAFENARYALDLIGRDIESAGFYPAIRASASNVSVEGVTASTYSNPFASNGPLAYNSPVFGCKTQRFSPAANALACSNHSSAIDADALVVNYYSNDAYGLNVGNRADCLRQDAANDATTNNIPGNVRRNAAHGTGNTPSANLVPQQPLFVSNRYTLVAQPLQMEGQTINTFSLACNGNGTADSDSGYQPMAQGIEQLRFFYLVRDSAANTTSYQRADAVAAADWGNVLAVRVCLVARTLQTARLQGSTPYMMNDCDDTIRNYADGIDRRVFSQTFAVKNKLNNTL